MVEPISQHLLQELREIEAGFVEDADPSEREELSKFAGLMTRFADQILQAKQKLFFKDAAVLDHFIQEWSGAAHELLDARYTGEMLGSVPLFVDRTLKLATLSSKYPASAQTNRYIREAARTYIYGLPLASVAMSRAAMEQSLRDMLGYQRTNERASFDDLVINAQKYGLLPKDKKADTGPAIRNVNKRCNEVMHQKPVTDDEAFELLSAARSVIEELHSADGGL